MMQFPGENSYQEEPDMKKALRLRNKARSRRKGKR
jgi:hypothetical protein